MKKIYSKVINTFIKILFNGINRIPNACKNCEFKAARGTLMSTCSQRRFDVKIFVQKLQAGSTQYRGVLQIFRYEIFYCAVTN